MRIGMRFYTRFGVGRSTQYTAEMNGHRVFCESAAHPIEHGKEYGCEVIARCGPNFWRVRILEAGRETVELWTEYAHSFGAVSGLNSRQVSLDAPEGYRTAMRQLPLLLPIRFTEEDANGALYRYNGVPLRPIRKGLWRRHFKVSKRYMVSPRSVGKDGIRCEIVHLIFHDGETIESLASEPFMLHLNEFFRFGVQGQHEGRVLCPVPGWIPPPRLGETVEVCQIKSPIAVSSVGFVVPKRAFEFNATPQLESPAPN